jgi:POT family proton-dependent oligopeptide transporter
MGAVAVLASTYILNYEEVASWFVKIAAVVVLGIFIYLISACQKSERAGLVAALVLTIQTVFFFIFYQQMSTSLNLFALRNVDWSFDAFGFHLWTWSPAQFQAFNPIWIMILSPILAWIYTSAGNSGKDFSIAAKFALGFAAVAVGFFIYSAAGHFTSEPGKTSSWVMVWGYGASSLGELLVSGLGLAMIARYVPARMGGFMMGAYYVASGISQYLGGIVANYASVPQDITEPLQTMPIYTNLFFKLGVAGVICTVIALAVLPWMKKLSSQHHAHNAATNAPLPTIGSEQ